MRSYLKKDFGDLPNCGETWELSGVEGNVSVVSEGELEGTSLNDLINIFASELVGKKVFELHEGEFPLLIKFIDANDDLSIQVHPDDRLASARHNSFGKTEMWYIMDAEPGAFLYNGFSRVLTPSEYQASIVNNTIVTSLNKEVVSRGDVYFIPAGRVHSIGKGILLAEIQQTSDITYRIYDFDRVDNEGNSRELHTEESLDAIDYQIPDSYKSVYQAKSNESVSVVLCDYFSTSIIELDETMLLNLADRDSFTALICVEGSATLEYDGGSMQVDLGDVLLIPAALDQVKLFSKEYCRLLETFVP